jgi:hypothetical protein
MNLPEKPAIIQSLADMEKELNDSKKTVEAFMDDIDNLSPDDMQFDNKDESLGEEDKEKISEIKTPEDAKKVLKTVKDDVDNVINSLDGLAGQTQEEKSASKFKRFNEKYANAIMTLSQNADKAIQDAQDVLRHWGFLRKAKKIAKKVTPSTSTPVLATLNEALASVEQTAKWLDTMAGHFGYIRKDATAVPPTGADFTGDKWPEGKNPAEVELRNWQSGADKFKRDKKFEDARPNASDENRLNTVDYPRSDKPFVNAFFHPVENNKFGSYWEVVDTKSNKKLVASFVNLPKELFPKNLPKNDMTFQQFASPAYGNSIVTAVIERGIDAVKKELDAAESALDKTTLNKVAAADKGNLRKYYTDAYGDAGYAGELTKGAEKEMNIGYTPKDDSVKNKKEETKDGPGKISSEKADPEVLKAKARRAVNLARKLSSRGALPFTYESIYKKAEELMELPDDQFQAKDQALDDIPVINEAALKEAHIPDTEIGIVGNTPEGVRDPMAKVTTEDIDKNVKSDATISKASSLIPQTFIDNDKKGYQFVFKSIKQKLEEKGITSDKLRIANNRQ